MSDQPVTGRGEARILDRGYRRYDGPRRGVGGAISTLTVHSIQRALGLRRSVWAKLLPFGGVLIAFLPAVVFVGVVALIPLDDIGVNFVPDYGDYYGYIIAAIMVFVALVAPEVLCTDRRSGMLGVYLASPLDRDTYLVGKALAIGFVLSLVCIGPTLLLLVANVLQNQGPEGATDIVITLLRVVGAGLAVTLLYTSITMGIASLTDRKSVASASIILVFLIMLMVTGILTAEGDFNGINVLSITLLSLDIAQRIHGEQSSVMRDTSTGLVWLAWAIWTVGGFTLARVRLHALAVTR
ncbi:MAG: ABC transporter permease [Aquihabitans sp.]